VPRIILWENYSIAYTTGVFYNVGHVNLSTTINNNSNSILCLARMILKMHSDKMLFMISLEFKFSLSACLKENTTVVDNLV
jgi:hypothetical protein